MTRWQRFRMRLRTVRRIFRSDAYVVVHICEQLDLGPATFVHINGLEALNIRPETAALALHEAAKELLRKSGAKVSLDELSGSAQTIRAGEGAVKAKDD